MRIKSVKIRLCTVLPTIRRRITQTTIAIAEQRNGLFVLSSFICFFKPAKKNVDPIAAAVPITYIMENDE